MEWLKKLFGTQEPSRPAPGPERMLRPVAPEQEKPEVPTFTEIGGSPVPGLTLRQVLRGHTDWIGRIAWSPDGAYLASPSRDKTIRIWDARSGACMRTLEGHTETVYSVAWSPDGHWLASGSADTTIRIWNVENWKTQVILEGHDHAIRILAWMSDGKRLASSSYDNTIRIWNTETYETIAVLKEGIVSGSPVGGLHFAQPTRCHPTTLNACYHVVLWCLSTCEMP